MRKRTRRRQINRINAGKIFDIIGLSLIGVMLAVIISSAFTGETLTGTEPEDNPPVHIDIKIIENDTEITLYNVSERRNETMALETYVCHCLAAEMPALYNTEALKANAVAIRTVIAERLASGKKCSEHKTADICSDSTHCQAYSSREQLKSKWGAKYDEYYQKVKECVIETAGRILIYDKKPIMAFYHSNSVNMTEDCVNVFNSSYPYLKSVDTPTDINAEYYETRVSYTLTSFVSFVNSKYPKAKLSMDTLRDTVKIVSRLDSGRVNKMKLGGVEIDGVEARELFGLKSANFSIGFSGDNIIIDTLGSGHGVGMSQVGANVMAEEGAVYTDILKHYYTGVSLGDIKDYI